MSRSSPSAAALLALAVAGLLSRLGLAAAAHLTGPAGEDMPMWGYRALELLGGVAHGSHPPLYPGLGAALSLTGLDLAWSLAAVAWISGVLMAPVFAWGASAVVGARAGVIAAVALLLQPALLAWSLRVEPSALFVVLLGLALGALGRAMHDGSVRAAAALGGLLFLLGLTKESGFYLVVPVMLALGLCERASGERRALVGAAALVFLGCAVPFQAWDRASPHGVSEKTALPMQDRRAFIDEGVVPKPLLAQDDPALALVAEQLDHLRAPSTSPGERAAWLWREQARRAWRFLRIWLLVAPAVLVGVGWLYRQGRLDRGSAVCIGALHALLAPAALVVVQARHAEVGLVGTWLGLGVLLAQVGGDRRGAALSAAVAALALAHGAERARGLEVERLGYLGRVAQLYDAVADEIVAALPEGAALCSDSYPVGWATRQLTQQCLVAPPADRPVLYAVPRATFQDWPARRPKATFKGAWQVRDTCLVLILFPPEDPGRPAARPDLSRVSRCRILPEAAL